MGARSVFLARKVLIMSFGGAGGSLFHRVISIKMRFHESDVTAAPMNRRLARASAPTAPRRWTPQPPRPR